MHVNNIPDDVLALVFQAVLPAIKRQLADAKAGLALLSVCRRWRWIALPMVYDTVVVKCGTEGTDGPKTVDIKTTLDLVVDARCLHAVRNVAIGVCYQTSPLQGLRAVIERMRGAAGEWAGVRKLELSLNAWGSGRRELNPPVAGHEDEIASVSSALAALMPGLREVKFDALMQTPIVRALYGQLAGFYADQLQVLHSSSEFAMPQDRVFARLRNVKIKVSFFGPLEGQLPQLDPEVVESLVLSGLTANDMWSMFCADSDGCAITFPRLINLELGFRSRFIMDSEQLSNERPWALQFPAAKRVQIYCVDVECPSMENAIFPCRLESLDITGCPRMLPVFAGRKVHVSRNLTISVMHQSDAIDRGIDIASRMLAESNSYNTRELVICGRGVITPELITYTGLTHLNFFVLMKADDVMGLIHKLPHLICLRVDWLTVADTQTDFSIPECAEHEPVPQLDTQIKRLMLLRLNRGELPELAVSILKYLLLRIPTLKFVTALFAREEPIQAFINEYVQWYPHLANIKFTM